MRVPEGGNTCGGGNTDRRGSGMSCGGGRTGSGVFNMVGDSENTDVEGRNRDGVGGRTRGVGGITDTGGGTAGAEGFYMDRGGRRACSRVSTTVHRENRMSRSGGNMGRGGCTTGAGGRATCGGDTPTGDGCGYAGVGGAQRGKRRF